jgi:hypothetical protein
VRDQIIGEQREVIANLWRILDKSGIGRDKVLDIAKQVQQSTTQFSRLSRILLL